MDWNGGEFGLAMVCLWWCGKRSRHTVAEQSQQSQMQMGSNPCPCWLHRVFQTATSSMKPGPLGLSTKYECSLLLCAGTTRSPGRSTARDQDISLPLDAPLWTRHSPFNSFQFADHSETWLPEWPARFEEEPALILGYFGSEHASLALTLALTLTLAPAPAFAFLLLRGSGRQLLLARFHLVRRAALNPSERDRPPAPAEEHGEAQPFTNSWNSCTSCNPTQPNRPPSFRQHLQKKAATIVLQGPGKPLRQRLKAKEDETKKNS
ncbi:hypothetical protein N431DRAFT_467680 [Stipitochalara longipes BDJ]|nr:hypothetical protein N431DRAFT_467680 [Stipitochalara longipes BDJ]